MLQTHSFVIPLHAKLQRDVSCIKRKDVTLFNPCLLKERMMRKQAINTRTHTDADTQIFWANSTLAACENATSVCSELFIR